MRISDWSSDVCSSDLREELGYLCDADVHASFVQAIDAREAEGQKLENRLIRIEKMQIADASVNGSIASITLRFEADIAAVTRDREGNVIAGSMTDAVPTHDVWTFSRDIKSDDKRVGKEWVSTCRSRW